jgi:hypothetical protein
MSWDTVDPNARSLGEPVMNELYKLHNKAAKINKEIERSIGWRPTLHLEESEFSIIAADVRSSPFPEALQLIRSKIANAHLPITIYAICSETSFSSQNGQKEARELKAHGLGLYTVNENGEANRQFAGIPIINHISYAEFEMNLQQVPKKNAARIRVAFQSYNHKPTSGVLEICDMVERFILDAAKIAIKKGWINQSLSRATVAKILDEMSTAPQFQNYKAEIGGARSFIKYVRNTASHSPKDRKQAYLKYAKCRDGFFDGIKVIDRFYIAMKNLGIKIK